MATYTPTKDLVKLWMKEQTSFTKAVDFLVYSAIATYGLSNLCEMTEADFAVVTAKAVEKLNQNSNVHTLISHKVDEDKKSNSLGSVKSKKKISTAIISSQKEDVTTNKSELDTTKYGAFG